MKVAVLELDAGFEDIVSEKKQSGVTDYLNELCDFRLAIIDYLIIQVDPKKVGDEIDEASRIIYHKYLKIMYEATT